MLNNKFFINSKPLANSILKKFYTQDLNKQEKLFLKYRIEKTRELILSSDETLDQLVSKFTKLSYFGVNFGYYILKQLGPSLSDNYNYKLHLKAIMITLERG